MTTVLHHEIIFYFIFVWPLLFLFSMLVAPDELIKRRSWLFFFLTGPVGVFYAIRGFLFPEREHASMPQSKEKMQKALLYLLALTWLLLLLTGAWIFFHKGWTSNYYAVIKWHAYVGYASLGLFLIVFLHHLRQHTRAMAWALAIAVCIFLFLLIFTLNEISWRYSVSLPLIFLIIFAFHWLRRQTTTPLNEKKFKGGVGLCFLILISYYTGVYLAEPFNSRITNNMALYILYIHGAISAAVLPFLFSMFLIHAGKPLPRWFPAARKLSLPVYLVLLLLLYPYAHQKWSGDKIEWRPVKALHRTEPSFDPVKNKDSFVPVDYHWTLDDYQTCAGSRCHKGLVEEWKYSTHRFSGSNIFFARVVEELARARGSQAVRFCQNCHDPVGAFHPDRKRFASSARWAKNEGVSCKICHSIQRVDTLAGNGAYWLRQEIPYPGQNPDLGWKKKWRDFIRWDLRLHFKNYSNPPLFQSPEYCVACHRTVATTTTGEKLLTSDVYESWRRSPYAKRGIRCRECHLDELSQDERGIYYPNHRFPGINQSLSHLVLREDVSREKLKAFEQFTVDWLQGKLPLRARVPRGPILSLKLSAKRLASESALLLKVKTKNERVGHHFPGGIMDLNEVWLEVKAYDADGKLFFHSGFLNEDLTLSSEAHQLGQKKLYNRYGELLRYHQIWEVEQVDKGRVIEPKQSVVDVYRIPILNRRFPITIEAAWNYRRARQDFVDWVFRQKGKKNKITFPMTKIVTAKLKIPSLETLAQERIRHLTSQDPSS